MRNSMRLPTTARMTIPASSSPAGRALRCRKVQESCATRAATLPPVVPSRAEPSRREALEL